MRRFSTFLALALVAIALSSVQAHTVRHRLRSRLPTVSKQVSQILGTKGTEGTQGQDKPKWGIKITFIYHEQQPMGYKLVKELFSFTDEFPGQLVFEHQYRHFDFNDKYPGTNDFVETGGVTQLEVVDIPEEKVKKIFDKASAAYYKGGIHFTWGGVGMGGETRINPDAPIVDITKVMGIAGLFSPTGGRVDFGGRAAPVDKVLNAFEKAVETEQFVDLVQKELDWKVNDKTIADLVDGLLKKTPIVDATKDTWKAADSYMKSKGHETQSVYDPSKPEDKKKVEDLSKWYQDQIASRRNRKIYKRAYFFFKNPGDVKHNNAAEDCGMIVYSDGTTLPLLFRIEYEKTSATSSRHSSVPLVSDPFPDFDDAKFDKKYSKKGKPVWVQEINPNSW